MNLDAGQLVTIGGIRASVADQAAMMREDGVQERGIAYFISKALEREWEATCPQTNK